MDTPSPSSSILMSHLIFTPCGCLHPLFLLPMPHPHTHLNVDPLPACKYNIWLSSLELLVPLLWFYSTNSIHCGACHSKVLWEATETNLHLFSFLDLDPYPIKWFTKQLYFERVVVCWYSSLFVEGSSILVGVESSGSSAKLLLASLHHVYRWAYDRLNYYMLLNLLLV